MNTEQHNQNDAILAGRAAKGDREAFSLLFSRWKRYVYSIAWKITLNEEDALDATQEVFAKLVSRLGQFKGSGFFRSWLGTIATRETLNLLRKPHRKRERPLDPILLESKGSHTGNPRTRIEKKEKRQLVEKAMEQLSPQQRAILTLGMKEDQSPGEIAIALGIPAKQVRSQLCRAVARIREILGTI